MSPAPAGRRARVSGGTLAYADHGRGRPVLLVHGFPTSSFLWRRETWLLAQRMRVIVPDLLGYGASDRPPDADLSEPAQARYLRELLGGLGIDEVAVVGHGIGGTVAQALALDHPDVSVRALVLLDAPLLGPWPGESGSRPWDGGPEAAGGVEGVERAVRRTLEGGVGPRHRLDEEAVRGFLRPWQEDPESFFRAARAIGGEGPAGREAELAALDLPVLLIWGEEDPYVPTAVAERLNELIPWSTLALLPGCSHFVTEEAPRTVGPLILEYLRSRYLGEAHTHAGGPVRVFLDRPPPEALDPLAEDGG